MPTSVKSADNLQKHLTKAEIEARERAEAEFMPDRGFAEKPPASLNKDAAGKKYWTSILDRMDGLAILDDLDREVLAIYCGALSRRDDLQKLCRELMTQAGKEKDPQAQLGLMEKLDGLMAKLQSHEKTLLTYADKLGMTPEARVRLARKRAAQAAVEEPDGDLFGD